MNSATAEPASVVPVVEGSDESEEFGITSALGMIATTICVVLAAGIILAALGSALGFYRADTVLSGSMRPAYPEGSVVVATRQDSHKLAVGQVIIFTAPAPYGEVVTHRVQTVTLDKKTGRPLVTTKGDNNPTADPWKALVPADEVWVVKGGIPLVGWVANWAVRWWPLLLAFVVSIPLLSFASNRIREAKDTDPAPVDLETDTKADTKADSEADRVEAAPVEAAPAQPAAPSTPLSRSLPLLWLLPVVAVLFGGYLVAASGRGSDITASAHKLSAEQPRNVNDSASGRGPQAAVPTASPTTTSPSRPVPGPGATGPTSANAAPSPSVAPGKKILAPGVLTLELRAGAAGRITIVSNTKQEVAQRLVDVVNASPETIKSLRMSATARRPTDRQLSVKVCAVEWMSIRGQAACPGAKYPAISQSLVPTSSILAPRPPLRPHQPLHLLLELRSPYGTVVAGPRADVTLRLDGALTR